MCADKLNILWNRFPGRDRQRDALNHVESLVELSGVIKSCIYTRILSPTAGRDLDGR